MSNDHKEPARQQNKAAGDLSIAFSVYLSGVEQRISDLEKRVEQILQISKQDQIKDKYAQLRDELTDLRLSSQTVIGQMYQRIETIEANFTDAEHIPAVHGSTWHFRTGNQHRDVPTLQTAKQTTHSQLTNSRTWQEKKQMESTTRGYLVGQKTNFFRIAPADSQEVDLALQRAKEITFLKQPEVSQESWEQLPWRVITNRHNLSVEIADYVTGPVGTRELRKIESQGYFNKRGAMSSEMQFSLWDVTPRMKTIQGTMELNSTTGNITPGTVIIALGRYIDNGKSQGLVGYSLYNHLRELFTRALMLPVTDYEKMCVFIRKKPEHAEYLFSKVSRDASSKYFTMQDPRQYLLTTIFTKNFEETNVFHRTT